MTICVVEQCCRTSRERVRSGYIFELLLLYILLNSTAANEKDTV